LYIQQPGEKRSTAGLIEGQCDLVANRREAPRSAPFLRIQRADSTRLAARDAVPPSLSRWLLAIAYTVSGVTGSMAMPKFGPVTGMVHDPPPSCVTYRPCNVPTYSVRSSRGSTARNSVCVSTCVSVGAPTNCQFGGATSIERLVETPGIVAESVVAPPATDSIRPAETTFRTSGLELVQVSSIHSTTFPWRCTTRFLLGSRTGETVLRFAVNRRLESIGPAARGSLALSQVRSQEPTPDKRDL